MDPVIKDSLTPVTIDDDGTVRKANLNEPWYSYENKKWANSVILQNSYESLSTYGNVYGATKQENYVSFDGQNDYIDLGLANYNFKDGITRAIRLQFNSTVKQDFFGNWETGGGGCTLVSFGITCNVYIGNDYAYAEYYTDVHLKTDYTIIFTYDNNILKLYIDGQKVAEKSQTGHIEPSTVPIFIGANPSSSGNHISFSNIDVKQAAIFDRAITEEEASKMTEDIKITNSEGLLKYVDFTNKKSEDYEPKEVIPEDVIESYFVWIPKYRYQLFNLGDYSGVTDLGNITTSASVPNHSQEIKIKFGDYNTVDGYKECETVTTSDNGNCKVGDYMTHPAFTAFEGSTGFWVGKFETGYLGATSTTAAQVNKQDTSKIIIKPNEYSWRNINVSNAHLNSYNYERTLESHLMKNSEWGAVAYLTNSKYGRCNGVNCEEVRMNNNSNHITGYSAKNVPTCGYTKSNEECNKQEGTELGHDGNDTYNYFNEVSQLSSTTGNYYGIYDMAGGTWEYVMGVMKISEDSLSPSSGNSSSNNSGFKGDFSGANDNPINNKEWPSSKYYDLYDYDTTTELYSRGILGDATKEIGPFYSVKNILGSYDDTRHVSSYNADLMYFVSDKYPWFVRGEGNTVGTDAGIFGAFSQGGGEKPTFGFRVTLTPTK